jgi:phosphatidylethanolamine/phosphatidyl-N-methylethanolamine N-methyltransferase
VNNLNDRVDQLNKWYSKGYLSCYYSGPLRRGWGLVHRLMERPYGSTDVFPNVLELGGGSGEHIDFVKHSWETYVLSDIRKPEGLVLPATVVWKEIDATNLDSIESKTIDRLIATCLIAHLPNPYLVLKEWRRVVAVGGIISIYVPTEPSVLLRAIRKLYIFPRARRFGLDNPKLLSAIDHPNHYSGIRACIEDVFILDQVKFVRFPVSFLGWNLSIFEIVQIKIET